jgi:hypothetical protein
MHFLVFHFSSGPSNWFDVFTEFLRFAPVGTGELPQEFFWEDYTNVHERCINIANTKIFEIKGKKI